MFVPQTFTLNGQLTFNDTLGVERNINFADGVGINLNGNMKYNGNLN